ncbi:Photosystem I chlorophyll a apoprotein A2 [compost metagenome]
MAGFRGASTLLAAALLTAVNGSHAQEPPYKAEILDLQATVLDLKGLPGDTSGGVADLTARVDGLTARHDGLSVRQDKNAVTVSMLGDVLFDFDKASIRPGAESALLDIAGVIKSDATGAVTVEGHTDSKGSASYNKDLSLRRAKAVAKWLESHGVDPARLSVKGLGDTRPVQPNKLSNGADNPQGRAQNRRVEFVLPKR